MEFIKSILFIIIVSFSANSFALTPRAPDAVWKKFLAGNEYSIPSNHWTKESGGEDSYVLKSIPDNFFSNLSTRARNTYSIKNGYPTFIERLDLGPQCVAFSKAIADVNAMTSQWKKGEKVITNTTAYIDSSQIHSGKVVAFFQGQSTYPSGNNNIVGHTGIFLKYQIDNNRIVGFWIADSNWKGSASNPQGKIRKHFLPIGSESEKSFDGRKNANNYFFVDI